MVRVNGIRSARFDLVTAAHHFVFRAVPLRQPESQKALLAFLEAAADAPISNGRA